MKTRSKNPIFETKSKLPKQICTETPFLFSLSREPLCPSEPPCSSEPLMKTNPTKSVTRGGQKI